MSLGLVWILVILVVLIAVGVTWRRAQRGVARTMDAQSGLEQGTMTLTGVSPRPLDADKNGEATVTISGSLAGPSTSPRPVYGRFVWKFADTWPEVGDQLAVVYKIGKADTTWHVGTLTPPPV